MRLSSFARTLACFCSLAVSGCRPADPSDTPLPSEVSPPQSPQTRILESQIPARTPTTPPELIDLTRFYNAALVGTWHPATQMSSAHANDLASLPTGVHRLDQVDFDLRGVIQLSDQRSEYWKGKFPLEVTGIPVGRKCRKLHFLQGTAFNTNDGIEIGHYAMHYADGKIEEAPIVYGEDVRDWWAYKFEPLTANLSTVAWTGTNAATAANGIGLRLYRSTWENPRPDQVIERIDFVSEAASSAPFLLAITAENP